MVTFLITSFLVLGLFALAIYFWQKPANSSDFSVNQILVATDDAETKITSETFNEAIEAIRAFQKSPNRSSTTKLLHIAALADDAKNYGRAVELVLMSWRDGSLADLSAGELQTLINSEYWTLSSHTRTSGAGFILKDTLAAAKSELEHTHN